jgi:FkbM family methyltransferase
METYPSEYWRERATKTQKIFYNNRAYYMRPLTWTDHIHQAWQHAYKFYEMSLLEEIRKLDRKGVYIDLGSHVGNHAIFFATQCPSTSVICVDAYKPACDRLIENFKANNVPLPTIYNVAITDQKGQGNMVDIGCSSHKFEQGTGEVASTTIDELLGEVTDVAVLKMDIEWSEARALSKATKFFAGNSPVVVVECATEPEFKEVNEIMQGYGYKTDKKNYTATPTYIWKKEE